MKTRPVEIQEYNEIIDLMVSGFEYETAGKVKLFRPNQQIAMILMLQSSLGLRVGDILELKLNQFKNGKLEIVEGKTKKLQYREINQQVLQSIYNYAIDNSIKKDNKLFSVGVRAVQKQLKIVVDYLELNNISTHSFRKLFATTIYESSNNDIELVRELLNHSNIATTQKYIRVTQSAIDDASSSVNFIR